MSDYIPPDCWPDILKYLPVRSVARFRCVCRWWNHLICSSSFIAHHLAHSKSKHLLFLNPIVQMPSKQEGCAMFDPETPDGEQALIHTPATPQYPRTRFYPSVGSVNGIVCLVDSGYSSFHLKEVILLWNPVINKYIKLPDPETHTRASTSVAIGVKPSEEDDIRVLRLSNFYPADNSVPAEAAEIYSVRQGAWRVLQANISSWYIYRDSKGKSYVNGAVHWIAKENITRSYQLTRFGFEEEEFSSVTLHDFLADPRHSDLHAAVYCERLALMQRPYNESCWKIWTMCEYGNVDSWSVIVHIDTIQKYNFIHGITHDGQILMSRNEYEKDDYLVLYNSACRSFRKLDMQVAWDGLNMWVARDGPSVCPFVESLVFMDGEGGAVSLRPSVVNRASCCVLVYLDDFHHLQS